MQDNNKKFVLILILSCMVVSISDYSQANEYIQVPGLIDLRTDFSDGAHTLDFLIKLAKKGLSQQKDSAEESWRCKRCDTYHYYIWDECQYCGKIR